MSAGRPIVYYPTAHGYGHSARTCDIVRGLYRRRPEIPVVVTSGVDEAFFRSRLIPDQMTWRHGVFDVGLVQLDSIRADIEATLDAWRQMLPMQEAFLQQEAAYLENIGAALVVSDIPSLPLEAAKQVGIPGVAVGNFGWDWIYAEYVDRDPLWAEIVERIEWAYRGADMLLQLPFSEPMSIFTHRRMIPLVAEVGRDRQKWMAHRTGADPGKPWFLLSFSTLDWSEQALQRVRKITDAAFFTVLPLQWDLPNIHALDRTEIAYQDVVASVDAVISKPGYGILSECAVNEKPLIYVERTEFLEYPILEQGLRQSLRHVHLPAAELYRGELTCALAEIMEAPPPRVPLAGGGADLAAEILADYWDQAAANS